MGFGEGGGGLKPLVEMLEPPQTPLRWLRGAVVGPSIALRHVGLSQRSLIDLKMLKSFYGLNSLVKDAEIEGSVFPSTVTTARQNNVRICSTKRDRINI